jgi:hypothetical protein
MLVIITKKVTSNKFLSELEGRFRASNLLLQSIWSANLTHTIILFADFIKFFKLVYKTQDTLVKQNILYVNQ